MTLHPLRPKPVAIILLIAWMAAFSLVPVIEARADSPAQATFYVH